MTTLDTLCILGKLICPFNKSMTNKTTETFYTSKDPFTPVFTPVIYLPPDVTRRNPCLMSRGKGLARE